MLPSQIEEIRQLLRDCSRQAAQMAIKEFEVFQKGFEDYVTSVDAALDARLFQAFSTLFPQDGVITEENVESRQNFSAGYDRLWCIDPIDGTEDFIHHRPNYAIMVGLLEHYQPIAGWISAPAYDQLYWGGKDWGLFQTIGDQPVQPLLAQAPAPVTSEFCPVVIGHRDQAKFGQAIVHYIPAAQFSSIGSFGLKVMQVIQGKAGLYVYFNRRVKIWDTAGPLALATAAGLVCCDLEGQPIQFTPDAFDLETLAHNQFILIGWQPYMEALRPKIRKAVEAVLQA